MKACCAVRRPRGRCPEGSSRPVLRQLEVKERSVSVTMVWPYFTVLSYILERETMSISAPLAVETKVRCPTIGAESH